MPSEVWDDITYTFPNLKYTHTLWWMWLLIHAGMKLIDVSWRGPWWYLTRWHMINLVRPAYCVANLKGLFTMQWRPWYRCLQRQLMLVKRARNCNSTPNGYLFTCWIYLRRNKNTFPCSITSRHWDGAGSWNSSSWMTLIRTYFIVNTITTDDMATQEAKLPATMVWSNSPEIFWCQRW